MSYYPLSSVNARAACGGVSPDTQKEADASVDRLASAMRAMARSAPPRMGEGRLGASTASGLRGSSPRWPTRLDKIKNLHSLDSIATETYGTHGWLTYRED